MNPAKKYLGDIIGGSIMLRESRLIAQLLLSSPSNAQWLQQIENGNLLQKASTHSAKRFASTIRKRLLPMGEAFMRTLIDADDTLAGQMMLLGIMNDSPVIIDFMKTELADAHQMFREKLEGDCWLQFYESRVKVIPELINFSESSIKKMGTNVVKILVDTEYLHSARSKVLQTVYVQPEILDWVNKLDKPQFADALQSGR